MVRLRVGADHSVLQAGVHVNGGDFAQNPVDERCGDVTQLPIGALYEPRATIPSCSISAIRRQVATGSSILRGQLLRYSWFGGCCDSMCCSARRPCSYYHNSRYIQPPVRIYPALQPSRDSLLQLTSTKIMPGSKRAFLVQHTGLSRSDGQALGLDHRARPAMPATLALDSRCPADFRRCLARGA